MFTFIFILSTLAVGFGFGTGMITLEMLEPLFKSDIKLPTDSIDFKLCDASVNLNDIDEIIGGG